MVMGLASSLPTTYAVDGPPRQPLMKADIHPAYSDITVTCSCGNVFSTGSTLGRDLSVEVCSRCHSFFTGKQKIIDTGGQVDKFNKRFKMGKKR